MISWSTRVNSSHNLTTRTGAETMKMSIKELETPRLRLRKFTPDDVEQLCSIFGNAAVTRYIGDGLPATVEQTRFALHSMLRHYDRHGFGRLAVVEKATGKLIGYGGLRSLEGVPELVYLLDEPYWNRGLASEIGRECLRHGFEDHGFERIVAMTKPGNVASRQVLQKLNMQFEGFKSYYDCEVVFYGLQRAAFVGLPAHYSVVQSMDWRAATTV
jgi:ribosomal-protein-alanine N-acetyltransferase